MNIEFETIKPWLAVPALIIIGLLVIKILCVIIRKTLKRTALDPVLHEFIVKGFGIVFGIILVGTVLSQGGTPISTILTMLGVAGAAIALALKDSLGNIAGGIIIIVSEPFKKGDMVEIMGVVGKVNQIDLLFTTLLTFDNKMVYIPNGSLSTSVIINYSREEKRRVDCKFGISADSSIPGAKEILHAVAGKSEMILSDPPPIIGVAEQSGGVLFLDMRVWCATEDVFALKYFLEENVKIAFDEAGIETWIPRIKVDFKDKREGQV